MCQILHDLLPIVFPNAEHVGVQGRTGLLLHLHLHQAGHSQVRLYRKVALAFVLRRSYIKLTLGYLSC
jgi:hypothetical protein